MPSPKLPFSVEEFRRRARRELPRALVDFVDGGAEAERTLRRTAAVSASSQRRLNRSTRIFATHSTRMLCTGCGNHAVWCQ